MTVRRAVPGLIILAVVLGLWAYLNTRPAHRSSFRIAARSGVEEYARSLIEPAGPEAWKLKRPYPNRAQVEQVIGAADETSSDYAWAAKCVWRTGSGETVAWFSKADGLLDALELNYGGLETVARDPAGYLHQPARFK